MLLLVEDDQEVAERLRMEAGARGLRTVLAGTPDSARKAVAQERPDVVLLWALLENMGYRQLTVLWRLRGLIKFLLGRSDWGTMERRGFEAFRSTPVPGR